MVEGCTDEVRAAPAVVGVLDVANHPLKFSVKLHVCEFHHNLILGDRFPEFKMSIGENQ